MTETPILLPDWASFERDYIESGIPHLFVVCSAPSVSMFVDQGADRIGARFEVSSAKADNQAAALAQIHIDDVVRDGRRHIEIWTDARHLFANFYRLTSEIVASVVKDRADPETALTEAVARWDALLTRPSLMSEETQAGLFGELWLLERLIAVQGPDAVEAWVGPVRQPHDFRLGDVELEVKTTSGSTRIHTVNGLGQLQPSLDCSLYLLSLKLANAGAGGRSLPEAIAAIEGILAASPSAIQRFQSGLAAVGYDTRDALLYSRKRRLRDAPVLIPVTDGMPRLTPDAIAQIAARFVPERIGKIVYEIDVEGCGFPDGSDAFHALIPAALTTPGA